MNWSPPVCYRDVSPRFKMLEYNKKIKKKKRKEEMDK